MKQLIEIVKLEKAHHGYKVLTSWRRPQGAAFQKKVDLWLPELAPGIRLLRDYQHGNIGWEDLAAVYGCRLHLPSTQDFLKPLALLSLRRKLVLLCDCPDKLTCPNRVLCSALEECRDKKDFVMNSSLKGGVT